MMKNIITIPNLISFFRLLLVPAFVITYFCEYGSKGYIWSVIIILLSGLSDIADGFIARHYHMVSDLGKVLDPIADKLTQVVVILSLTVKHTVILPMFIVLFIKELLTLFVALQLLSNGTKPISSKWFGKLSTVVIFMTMFYTILVDIYGISEMPMYILMGVSIVCMVISVTGYFRLFFKHTKGEEVNNEAM